MGNALTQGAALAGGLQRRFDFAGLAVAGVAGGVGAWVGAGSAAAGRQIGAGAASALAGAATRSIATGTSFGDNVLAVLPDVVGATIGRVVAGVVARAGQAAAMRRAASSQTGSGNEGFHANASALDDERASSVASPTGGSGRRPARYGFVTVEEIPPEPGPAATKPGDAFPRTDERTYSSTSALYADWANAENINDGYRLTTSRDYADMAEIRDRFRSTEARLLALGDLATQQVDIPLAAFVGANVTTALTLGVGGTAGLGTGGALLVDGIGGGLASSLYRRAGGERVTVRQAATDGAIAAAGGLLLRPVAGYVGGKIHGAIDRIGLGTVERLPSNLISRLGPKGVDPLHHNANVLVRDAQDNVIAHQRFVSGNMTLEEQALGFPRNTLASHTEARAVRSMELQLGSRMTITGQNSPCPSCKGAMNRAASESGATIKYQWRQNGKTVTWTATPK